MAAGTKLKHKRLFKIELLLIKVMPMIISLAYIIIAFSSCLGINMAIVYSLASMSMIPLLFMYITSYVFGFCAYHRMFLHYIAVNDVVNIYDLYIGISEQYMGFITFNIGIVGILLFLILYVYVKNHKRVTT